MIELILRILAWIIGSLAGLGLFFGGAGYLISKFKGGRKDQTKESTDIISSNDQIKVFYKEQNDDYKVIIKEQNLKIEGLTREVGEIKGQLNAEQKQNKLYLDILQNRDPETKKFMEFMIDAMKQQSQVNTHVMEVLGKLHGMATDEKNRDLKITTTVAKSTPGAEPAHDRREDDKTL